MEDKISDYVPGFRKSRGAQHTFLMLERWKQAIDKG